MHVGIPVMKCSLHPSTQVNSRTVKAAKTWGLGSAWREMNDERLGRDTTIDRSMTDLNVWMVGDTSDKVEDIVQKKIDEINEERHDAGLRSLRSDAVSVAEIVEKPPIDFMQNLSYEERKQFLNDSHAVMEKLIHEWNPDWKIIEAVQHHDEFGGLSAHNHELILLTSHDKNGIATMQAKSELNLKFFNFINKNYSEEMRKFGYDVEDVRTYDRLSEEEKQERKLHPEQHGVDAYVYKQKKQEEMTAKLESMKAETAELSDQLSEAKNSLVDIQTLATAAKVELDVTKEKIGDLHKEKEALVKAKDDYALRAELLTRITESPSIQSYADVLKENSDLKEELSWKDKVIDRLQEEKLALQETVNHLKESVQEWKEKFSELTHKAGQRLMKSFGFDVSYDNSVKEFPEADVTNALKEMKEETAQYDPATLRVVPDRDFPGTYQVASRMPSGELEKIHGQFTTRDEAEAFRRNYGHAAEDLNEELKETFKSDMKIK